MKTFLLASLFITACASIPPVCTPEGSKAAGFAQAMRGDEFNLSPGSQCQDENVAIFKDGFNAGYQEGKAKYCKPETFRERGKNEGKAGSQMSYAATDARICSNEAELKQAYGKGHSEGLVEFCSTDAIKNDAAAYGEKGLPFEFSKEKYAVCGSSRLSKLNTASSIGHKAGLAKFCHPESAKAKGMRDGSSNGSEVDAGQYFALCGASKRTVLAKSYSSGYEAGLKNYCSENKLNEIASTLAAKVSITGDPEELTRCFAKYPHLRSSFQASFGAARESFVSRECTHQRGRTAGEEDARRIRNKNGEMPSFCNSQMFSVYFNGYVEGWRGVKAGICDHSGAYNRGVEDGRNRRTAVYNPADLCPDEDRQAVINKYHEGYAAGSHQSPVTHPYATDSSAAAVRLCQERGYSYNQCRDVTSVACIEKGYAPSSCRLPAEFPQAVDACIRRGYSPASCRDVRDQYCIERGNPPSRCR